MLIGNFAAFAIIFAAISTSAFTFGAESPNYWRESSAGLYTRSYFCAKWLANVPRILASAAFFFGAFIIQFSNVGSQPMLYLCFLMLYFFGYSLGYFAGVLVPLSYTSIVGVFALIFCLSLSGMSPTLPTVSDMPKAQQNIWALSGPRWINEAFYINSISYYQFIPSGMCHIFFKAILI